MTKPKPPPLNREQRKILRLCRGFLREPAKWQNMAELCGALTSFELDVRFAQVYSTTRASEADRAEVKELELCRDCRVKLDATNRANVSGYQCLTCKRKAHATFMAKQRADKKEAAT
jgi:hypothetical protein